MAKSRVRENHQKLLKEKLATLKRKVTIVLYIYIYIYIYILALASERLGLGCVSSITYINHVHQSPDYRTLYVKHCVAMKIEICCFCLYIYIYIYNNYSETRNLIGKYMAVQIRLSCIIDKTCSGNMRKIQ
jgi:hypothetical protein